MHDNGSDPRTDVSHEVCVDPIDDAGIDISHLEQRWNLWVSGTAIDPNHVCHAPRTIRVSNDHGDGRTDGIKNAGIENKKKPSGRKPPRR